MQNVMDKRHLESGLAYLRKVKFGWELEELESIRPNHKKELWDNLTDVERDRLRLVKKEWDALHEDERESIRAMRMLGYSDTENLVRK